MKQEHTMPITSVTTDPTALTLTIVGDFPVTVERLWDAWADPRQIERFWGPPSWPATFTRHDMSPGGESHYFMTGPEGERAAGYWRYEAVERYRHFEVVDGFTRDDGTPNDDMPTINMRFSFEPTDTGSRFVAVSTFDDVEQLEQMVAMGMVEGMQTAMGQMDEVLADLAAFAGGRGTELKRIGDTQARTSRLIRGTVDQVWRAHHDSGLMQRWLLGPDGWTMPVCEIAVDVGDTYRYEWESEDGSTRFGFEGELLDSLPPHRAVTTERMIGTDGPSTLNEMTLVPVEGGTLLVILITYPSTELREEILATGMVDGMETSYARLESVLDGVDVPA
jgi:uncharacterized protein YndB with AHSA1/START domain